MKQPSRVKTTSPIVYGIGALFIAGAAFFLLQQDQTATDARLRGVVQQRMQIQLAEANAREIRSRLITASRILAPYCSTQIDSATQLVFAALNLSQSLRPTINAGSASGGSIPSQATPAPTPIASGVPNVLPSAAAAAQQAAQSAENAFKGKIAPTPAPISDTVTTRSLTTQYSGDFSSLVIALNAFAKQPAAIGINLSQITRGAVNSQTTQQPPQTGVPAASPTPIASPTPGNQLTITTIFNRPILTPDACARIQQYAGLNSTSTI